MPAFLQIPEELAPVQQMLGAGLARVQRRFDEQLASDLLPVERLCRHVEHYRGKMLRPMLVMLSGLACGDREISEEHVTIAAVCEMVHMATLVHDDVLDEAENRRRGRTVNHLYGNEAAVILGDYLIAGAYHLCTSLDSVEAARRIGEVSMVLCAGELLQLHFRDDYSLDEATYFEILERKTAALIGVACRLGAALAGARPALCEAMEAFGRRLGVAFQIQDDLLDLTGEEAVVGKSVGKDLEKGKLTLPVLIRLADLAPAERGRFLALLEGASAAGEEARAAAGRLRRELESSGAIARATERAAGLVAEARAHLGALPAGPARDMLDLMARAVVDRRS
ncbi:MAG TPA: polyprenyl synthetase family protein [Phycisphaerales bacterium]|nr:polyprenyl synthetase family protein [Phycisphaerales bacterium]